MMMIISNVKEIMEQKKITIRFLVAKTGLSDKTILRARSENIIECRLSTLQVLAEALDCQIKDLFVEKIN